MNIFEVQIQVEGRGRGKTMHHKLPLPDSVASRTRYGLSQGLGKSPLSCRKDDYVEVNVSTSYSFSFCFVFSKLMDHVHSKFSFCFNMLFTVNGHLTTPVPH